jgi:hypothetical protein
MGLMGYRRLPCCCGCFCDTFVKRRSKDFLCSFSFFSLVSAWAGLSLGSTGRYGSDGGDGLVSGSA